MVYIISPLVEICGVGDGGKFCPQHAISLAIACHTYLGSVLAGHVGIPYWELPPRGTLGCICMPDSSTPSWQGESYRR